MKRNLGEIVDSFKGLRALVIGEAILDTYLAGTAGRVSQEAPVPVVTLTGRRHVAGGAANTAVNVRCLGAAATVLSVTGDDDEGVQLRAALAGADVETDSVLAVPSRRTLAKNRLFAASQMVVRFDEGSTEALDEETERALVERLRRLWPGVDAVVVSDYGYGIVTPGLIEVLGELQDRDPRVLVVDARDLRAFRSAAVTAVKPNFSEALELLSPVEAGGEGRVELVVAAGNQLLDETGARIAAVTLDSEGVVLVERDRPAYRTYWEPLASRSPTGAGDTFASALALTLAAGGSAPEAAEIASAAAALVVGKEGTSACAAEELRETLSGGAKHVEDRQRLVLRARLEREQGRRIVFTNGVFDILHRGHVTLLSRAKELGDVLVVGINSDESVRRLKGAERPVNTVDDRVQVLAALSCVDYIVPFEEDTPDELIRAIRPDVFVKGGDYTRKTLPEAALVESLGGVVRILPYVEDRSTTDVIERIRTLQAAP
jgi:D-beta-D-heptose 7-phosphate kinase / D-beta-D-heptose 1-phosphate adenosyltransferase